MGGGLYLSGREWQYQDDGGNWWDGDEYSLYDGDDIITENVIISNNTAYERGGGIFIERMFNSTLENIAISENIAEFGGGIFLQSMTAINLNRILINGNIANQSGGGILDQQSVSYISNTIIYQNTAGNGGGIFLSNTADEDNLLSNDPSLQNAHSIRRMKNNIVWNNGANPISAEFNLDGDIDPEIYTLNFMYYSNVQGGIQGVGNIDMDPLFVNPENFNYTLLEESPCIDSGTTDTAPFCLSAHANVISWPCNMSGQSFATSEFVTSSMCGWGIIASGVSGIYNEEFGWLGSLTMLTQGHIYILISQFSTSDCYKCLDLDCTIDDPIIEYCGSAPDMGAFEYITEDCVEEECGAELADVSGDGQINVLDLVQISYYVLELSTPAYPCAADYNQDGQINILDLVQISNYILYP